LQYQQFREQLLPLLATRTHRGRTEPRFPVRRVFFVAQVGG
jgi:hypothetical protein